MGREPRIPPAGAGRATVALLAGALLCVSAPPGHADPFDVSNTDDLRQAILSINEAPSSDHSITFQQSFTLDAVLTPIIGGETNTIAIVGNGHTVSGGGEFQIFFVDAGTVTIDNLVLADGYSRGGDAGLGRGGGGLGAGGALFVNTDASVRITDVFFRNNTAQGGNGGGDAGPNVGGGGGGFHGDGGDFGGGGGYDGRGGIDGGGGGGLEGNGLPGELGGNGGGQFDDGDGGVGNPVPGGTGGAGGEFEGGGFGSAGGAGGRFGGGGGGSAIGGGSGGDFGGGGGAADINADPDDEESDPLRGFGGKGGFGGGGGGSSNGTVSEGGFGGGDGAITGVGGAGSSLGGAVFVRSGGTLSIGVSSDLLALSATGDVTSGNRVERAALGSGSPEVRGSDLYLMNGVTTEIGVESGLTATFRGTISGEGGLTKADLGTLVLVGANSYSGGTTVEAGILQGTTASLPGDIVVESGGSLRLEQSGAGSYGGVLSGAGDLVKAGTGNVTLSGDNLFTGATTIEEGILSVTAASLATTSGTSVADGATLRFDQTSDASYARPIAGGADALLEKRGSGRLTLTADYATWAGMTQVTGGELVLTDALGGRIDVGTGGRLGGSGTATGDVNVSGVLAPGPSGTQTLGIGGVLDLAPGAVLEVDVTDSGASDQVSVGGSADVDGAFVTVLPAAGDYTSPISYDILVAAGGITGAPVTQDDFCFFDTLLAINGNALQLTLTPDLELDGSCSRTRNQRAVGGALEPVILVDPALVSVRDSLNVLTEAQVPEALDQMSGEGLAGFGNARLAVATRFLGSVSERMRHPSPGEDDAGVPYPLSMQGPLLPSLGANASLGGPLDAAAIPARLRVPGASFARRPASPFTFVSQRGESGLGGWLDGFATFASVEGSGGGSAGSSGSLPQGTHDQDFNLYGTSGGIDWAFAEGGMLGAAFGYTRSKLSTSDLTTWGTGDTFQGAVYAAWATKRFYLGGAARYAWTNMETTRRITFGSLYEKADGDFDGSSISGYLEAGLAAFQAGDTFFQPSASFQYTYLDTEEFSESGAPGLNLNLDSESFSSEILNLGLRVYHPFEMDPQTDIIPELRVRWAHEFGDLERTVSARFDDATAGPAVFRVKGAEVGRDVAVVGAGWTVVGEGNLSLSLDYDATLNEDLVGHTVGVGVLLYW